MRARSARSRSWSWALAAAFVLFLLLPAAASALNLKTIQDPRLALQTAAPQTSSTTTASSTIRTKPRPVFESGELIVRFKAGVSADRRAAVHSRNGGKVVRSLLLPDTYLISIDESRDVPQAAAEYRRSAYVKFAEPNLIYRLASTLPNDTSFGEQWALHSAGQYSNGNTGSSDADIDAPEAWDTTTGSSSVTVGVIDTGVDYNNPDLAPNISSTLRQDFIPPGDADPMDDVGHGTHVAAIIGARGNNGLGVTGVSWQVEIAPLRACDSFGCSEAALIDAFTYAGQNGIEVANASISGPQSDLISQAITNSPNTLFVVAAGNGGDDGVGDNLDFDATSGEYPCSETQSNVICVTATDQDDKLAPFSNYGATSVDLAAPGRNILGYALGNSLAYAEGTSQAAPQVAGAAALFFAANPAQDVAGVRKHLLDNVDPKPTLTGKTVTGGRLNVNLAVGSPPPPLRPGILDPTFDSDGKVTTDFGLIEQSNAVAVQQDGKIVAAGTTNPGGGTPVQFALARYNQDGTLDSSFGSGGKVTTDFASGADDIARAVAIQSDGRILVGGTTCPSGTCDAAVARYNPDGSLDSSFATGGKFSVNVTPNDQVNAVAVQADGKILLSGLVANANYDFALGRLTSTGVSDTSLGGTGLVTTDFGGNERATSMKVQGNGKIVVGGTKAFDTSSSDFAIARYNPDGSLDNGFDADGKQTTDVGFQDEAKSVALQDDGKIVAGGFTNNQSAAGKIAFQSSRDGNSEIYVMDANGNTQTRLTNNSTNDFAPEWSPDGSKIVFSSFRDGNEEIYAMNADGTGQTRLTNNSTGDYTPTWSPDGARIAFASLRDGNAEIYSMNADGTVPTRLTNNPTPDERPSWSPDGSKIAFDTTRGGNEEIYTIATNGLNPTNLTNNATDDFSPDWSPDGTKIAFDALRDGNKEIYTMNADGSGQTNRTNAAGDDFRPAWTSDGTKISFDTLRDGNLEVYTMSSTGAGQTRLTNNGASDSVPDHQPQGARFALTRYMSDGTLDSNFGISGKVRTRFPGGAVVNGIGIQSTGEIVAAGGAEGDTALARYKKDGFLISGGIADHLDRSFGDLGRVTTNIGGTDAANAVAIQSDGKIVTSGNSGSDFALARYTGTRPTVTVSPNLELTPAGQSVTVTGRNFVPNDPVTIEQQAGNQTTGIATATPDSNGSFSTSVSVQYTRLGTDCNDPNCSIEVPSITNSGVLASAPISFKAAASIVNTPSNGQIGLGQSIDIGQSVFNTAVVTGNSSSGTPTGTASFYVCGPVESPATCGPSGTPLPGNYQVSLSPGANNTASASSDPFTPTAAGRYCFITIYSGDNKYRGSTDASKVGCVSVTQTAPALLPTFDSFDNGRQGTSLFVPADQGVLANDHANEPVTAVLDQGPTSGSLGGGLQPDGSFVYTPTSPLFVGTDSFTYHLHGSTSNTDSTPVTALINVKSATDVGSYKFRAYKFRAYKFRSYKFRTGGDVVADLEVFSNCSSRFISLNPELTLYTAASVSLSAALYDQNGQRIATTDGYLLNGNFEGDLASPLVIDSVAWDQPAPPGGATAEVFIEITPVGGDTTIGSTTVACET